MQKIKEKRLKKSLDNNPTYRDKLETADKHTTDQDYNKKKAQKEIKNSNKKNVLPKASNQDDPIVFIGMTAAPGRYVRMRSNKQNIGPIQRAY